MLEVDLFHKSGRLACTCQRRSISKALNQPVSTMFAILAAVRVAEISFAFWLRSAFCSSENTVVFVGATNGVNLKIVLAP